MKEPITMEVKLEMDSQSGNGYTSEDFADHLQAYLTNIMPHYNPVVTIKENQVVNSVSCVGCGEEFQSDTSVHLPYHSWKCKEDHMVEQLSKAIRISNGLGLK